MFFLVGYKSCIIFYVNYIYSKIIGLMVYLKFKKNYVILKLNMFFLYWIKIKLLLEMYLKVCRFINVFLYK